MGMPFEGNCIHPRTKIKKNGSVFCLACHQIIKEIFMLQIDSKKKSKPKPPRY